MKTIYKLLNKNTQEVLLEDSDKANIMATAKEYAKKGVSEFQ